MINDPYDYAMQKIGNKFGISKQKVYQIITDIN